MKKPKLKVGEVLCRWCEGKGRMFGTNYSYATCNKCFGTGKLDWIDNAKGGRTPRPLEFSFDTSASMSYMNLSQTMLDEMAKDMAAEIDKEIFKSISNTIKKEENF